MKIIIVLLCIISQTLYAQEIVMICDSAVKYNEAKYEYLGNSYYSKSEFNLSFNEDQILIKTEKYKDKFKITKKEDYDSILDCQSFWSNKKYLYIDYTGAICYKGMFYYSCEVK